MRPQRHVGHQPQPHRLGDALPQLPSQGVHRAGQLGLIRHLPIPFDMGPAVPAQQSMPGRQAGDADKPRRRFRYVLQGQEVGHGLGVESRCDSRMGQHGLYFRTKDQSARDGRVIKRFFAKRIAGQKQFPALLVPDGQGKHAAQARHTGRPQLLIEVDDDLGVAAAGKDVALGHKLLAKSLKIINFAVKNNGETARFIKKRLIAGDQIDDRQPAMGQGRAAALGKAVKVDPLAVRAAMGQTPIHHGQNVAHGVGGALIGDKAADAAHAYTPSPPHSAA